MTDARADTVIRVLNGRLAGTELDFLPEGRVSIGHDFWHDVTIRDPAARGVALDVTFVADGAPRLAVLSGEVVLLGSTLGAGQSALLPAFVPVEIGGIALAWGERASSRWREAGALTSAGHPTPSAPADAQTAVDLPAAAQGGEAMRGWRPAALVGVGALLIAGTAAVPTVRNLDFGRSATQRVDAALDASRLGYLEATGDPANPQGVTVSGVVGREADRVRAQTVLAATGVPGTVDVQTSAELASSSADVARINGVDAVARPVGRTTVELRTTPLQPHMRTKLDRAVKSDVTGVSGLVIREDLVADEDAQLRTVADATKKVSTVVAGDPAYIQTSDGAHYFIGAMMPTGHRLVAIQDQAVLLEKNGRRTRLAF